MSNSDAITNWPIGYLLLKIELQKKNKLEFYQEATNKEWQSIFGKKAQKYKGHKWTDAYPQFDNPFVHQQLKKAWHSESGLIWKMSLGQDNLDEKEWLCSAHKISKDFLVFTLAKNDTYREVIAGFDREAAGMNGENRQNNKALEKEVRNQTRKYESAADELSSFTYSVSHDLRAPLRRLDGFSEALLNEKYLEHLDENAIHYLQRIRQAARDMGQLIDDLLKLSRISTAELKTENIDLTTFVRKTFTELIAGREGPSVALSVEDNLQVTADPGLVKILLQNLLDNAIKYSSKEEEPEISVGQVIKDNSDGSFFYIKDNGVGFDMKYAHKLFRPFSRLHSDFEFEGSGIGLATVQRIINIHGGTIRAESKNGEGTTIYFQITRNV